MHRQVDTVGGGWIDVGLAAARHLDADRHPPRVAGLHRLRQAVRAEEPGFRHLNAGDGVQVGTNGVTFLRADFKDPFSPLERVVKGSPVLVQGRAAVLGMQDGRLRIYDLRRVPSHDVRRLPGDGEAISAIAAFDSSIAAGNARGVVKVFEIREGGTAA